MISTDSAMRRFPLSFIVLTGLGLLVTVPGVAAVMGYGARIHSLLADTGAGIALLVSGVALIGSGMFPLVISRLMRREAKAER
ncbi:MAG TPA: hypothetical protein VFW68_14520 [Rhodocyclaceae bacterium]|nr:hypothetical protein [Rhodocyclaceae bacterium]